MTFETKNRWGEKPKKMHFLGGPYDGLEALMDETPKVLTMAIPASTCASYIDPVGRVFAPLPCHYVLLEDHSDGISKYFTSDR